MKDDQIEQFPTVTLAFADTSGNKYVAITGEAVATNTAPRSANFGRRTTRHSGFKDDPHIRLITVTPYDAEVWDSPGMIVATVKMVTAAITGAKVNLVTDRRSSFSNSIMRGRLVLNANNQSVGQGFIFERTVHALRRNSTPSSTTEFSGKREDPRGWQVLRVDR